MSIDAIIYCFNDAPLADCLNCPHFSEHSGSIAGCRIKRMGQARRIVNKYREIEEIMSADLEHIHPLDKDKYIVASIKEVINGNNHWIDDADHYICPVCGFIVANPNHFIGRRCPQCGFQDKSDKEKEDD